MEISKQIHLQTKPEQEQQEPEPESEPEFSIHGDVLEFLFTHVPLIHLVPALHVSPAWKLSVLTSLRRLHRVKPWLVLHTQSTRSPYSLSLHAFDPRSEIWIRILPRRPIGHVSALRSSDSNLVYMISPSKLSFSFDPLYQNWIQIDAPPKWRTDPVVALVGRRVVVAGGTCDFEDDPLAVEIYDLDTRRWDSSGGSMPAVFNGSAAATWLSVAVAGDKMLIMHKTTGISHWFDPETKIWVGPFNLFPDPKIYRAEIRFANEKLILFGFIGDDEGKMCGLKMWEIPGESPESWAEIGEMPARFVEKLRGEDFGGSPAAAVNVIGDFVYVSNGLNCEDVFLCEFCGGADNWSSFLNLVVNEKVRLSGRIVYSSANVALVDLIKAIDEGVEFDVVGKD